MITVLLSFLLILSVSSVSAASTVYVNAMGGSDSNSGTIDHPYQTIGKAISSVDSGGTVIIADGTYTGTGNTNLTISKNIIIIGQHQKKTIIDGKSINWIFNITRGVTINIRNLTLTNGKAGCVDKYGSLCGGAIYNSGVLDIAGCTFKNNTDHNGGSIYNDGTITGLSGCTFTGNTADFGGAICNRGNINSLSGCNFTNNLAVKEHGGAIWNDGTITSVSGCTFTENKARGGGAICNYGTFNVDVCTFTNNAALGGGAILNYCTINVSGSTFRSNSARDGGAITNLFNNASIHFNSFVNNTATNGNALYNDRGSINADYNWWGSNRGPSGKVVGTKISKWLILTVKSNPKAKGISTITADMLHDNKWIYHNPANGHVPNGMKVTFTTTLGTIKSPVCLINGIAKSTLNRGSKKGTAYISAKVDNQAVQIPPKVISTSLKKNTTGALTTTIIAIKFNENIKKSINWSKIIMKNKYGHAVAITKSISGNTLYIKTSSKKPIYSYYAVYVPVCALKDYTGNNLAIEYTFNFKTAI